MCKNYHELIQSVHDRQSEKNIKHKQLGAASLGDGSASDDESLVNAKQSDDNKNNNNNNIVTSWDRNRKKHPMQLQTSSVGVHLPQNSLAKQGNSALLKYQWRGNQTHDSASMPLCGK